MKRILTILVFALGMSVSASAQSAIHMPTVAGDTLSSTDTVTKSLPQLTGAYAGVVLQGIMTRLSGTAGGSVAVYGSLDGSNFQIIDSARTMTNVANQNFAFYIKAPIPQWIRMIYYSSGTQSVKTTTWYKLNQY